MMANPNPRRTFVTGMALLPAAGLVLPVLAQGQGSVERFRVLSARLTGFPVDALDRTLARRLLQGLLAIGEGPALDELQLAEDPGPDIPLSRRIIGAWYSGIHPTAQGTALGTYQDALAWRALTFTKPPGLCSPGPDDWARPPASEP